MKTIDTVISGRDNNFNLIRFVAATMVIVAHSYVLTGHPWRQISVPAIREWNLARIAVDAFFVTSGFLISMSFLRQPNIWLYLEARILRIFPALLAAVLLTSLILGPIFTELPLAEYFKEPSVYEYIVINSTLVLKFTQLKYTLPGVFVDNPSPETVNGSLWTLPYEMWMYIALLAIGLTRILKDRGLFNAFYLLLVLGVFLGPVLVPALSEDLSVYARFALLFQTGTFFYVNRTSIPINGYLLLGLVAALWLLKGQPAVYGPAYIFTLAYCVLWIAFVPNGFIRKFNQFGDYSYGLYIYAFPIQQMLIALFPAIGPMPLLVSAFFVTLLAAMFSWYVIEKPALSVKGSIYPRFIAWRERLPGVRKPQELETKNFDTSASE